MKACMFEADGYDFGQLAGWRSDNIIRELSLFENLLDYAENIRRSSRPNDRFFC